LVSIRKLTFRPRAQCNLRDATKLILIGPIGSLDGHSVQHSHHVMGQFGWVSVFRKIAFAPCSLKAATQRSFGCGAERGYFIPNRSGRISARQRTLDDKASCWSPRVTWHVGGAEENLFDNITRLPRRQSLSKKGKRSVHVSIKNFAKELLLVAKRSVKTWSINAHGPREIGKRSAFVTFRPKNMHGTIQGRIRIEGTRPSKLCSGC
jgi:hypothetical protein